MLFIHLSNLLVIHILKFCQYERDDEHKWVKHPTSDRAFQRLTGGLILLIKNQEFKIKHITLHIDNAFICSLKKVLTFHRHKSAVRSLKNIGQENKTTTYRTQNFFTGTK